MITAFLAAVLLLLVLTNPFHKKKNAWDFYESMVKGYEDIQHVELSELEGDLRAVVTARNECYGQYSDLGSRLSICRKEYLSDILALSRQKVKAAPSLGKFMLCVRECPLAYSMCRGTEPKVEDTNAECAMQEVRCIESCLDQYWRGTE